MTTPGNTKTNSVDRPVLRALLMLAKSASHTGNHPLIKIFRRTCGRDESKPRGIAILRANFQLSRRIPGSCFRSARCDPAAASLLGFVKVGGYVNNFSLTHVFLALTMSTMLIRLYAEIKSREHRVPTTSDPIFATIPPMMARSIVLASLALFALWHWPQWLLQPSVRQHVHAHRQSRRQCQ